MGKIEKEGLAGDRAYERAQHLKRLWTLGLLMALVVAAGRHFVGLAAAPEFQIHSDDLMWMYRYQNLPRAALPTTKADYVHFEYLPGHEAPADDLAYIHGLDQPAFTRYVFHYLLSWAGKLPAGELADWDYAHDFQWNVEKGNVAPREAVRVVRVVNAALMIGAAALVFIAVARAVTPAAGFVAGLYLVLHSATVDVMWSIGSDPLLWFCMAGALLLWVGLGASLWGAILLGVAGGLAAGAKINGAIVVIGYAVWVLAKRRPKWALLSLGAGLLTFVLVNPICFARGVLGVPRMLWELVAWRSVRAEMTARHFPAYAGQARWRLFFYLLGSWWVLLPLVLVSRRFRRLEPAVWWAMALTVGHALTVMAPLPRYLYPLQAGLVIGAITAYWPMRLGIGRRWLRGVRERLSGGG